MKCFRCFFLNGLRVFNTMFCDLNLVFLGFFDVLVPVLGWPVKMARFFKEFVKAWVENFTDFAVGSPFLV